MNYYSPSATVYGRNAVREDIHGRQNHIRQTLRPVRSVDGDIKLNRALWTLADEMAKLKA